MKFISRHAEFFEFYLSAWILFSGDLNTTVDFSDFILVKIYSKFDVRKKNCL